MAQTFSGNIKFALAGTFTGDNDLSSVTQAFNYLKNYNITNGTGLDQANMIWADTRTITASSSETLDLSGSLANAFGTTISFTSIKGLIIVASASNVNNVLVGGNAAGALAGLFVLTGDAAIEDVQMVIPPGGMICLVNPGANGYAITNTTGDVLAVANSSSGSSVVYDIILLGEV